MCAVLTCFCLASEIELGRQLLLKCANAMNGWDEVDIGPAAVDEKGSARFVLLPRHRTFATRLETSEGTELEFLDRIPRRHVVVAAGVN